MLKRKHGQLVRALRAEKVAMGWVLLPVTICLGILLAARLLIPRVPWDPTKQWI